MKHQFLLFLALLGAVLLWPGCEDDDGIILDCTVTVPFVPFSDDCTPEVVNLFELNTPQAGQLPPLPESCSSGSNSRIVRLNGSSDGDSYLHIYVGIPATITYDVYGADCENNVSLLQECVSSNSIAIDTIIEDGADFSDVYVRIKYDIFTTDNYVDYALQPDSYISVAAYDELPKALGQSGGISYNREGDGPTQLFFNCDETAFQRIIITSCERGSSVAAWARELGLKVSEQCIDSTGFSFVALDVPEGMNTDFVGDGTSGPGGADKPLTTERRPKKDSTDFIVEEDYIITVPSSNNGLFPLTDDCSTGQGPSTIGPDNTCFKPDDETLACLAFDPGNGSEGGQPNVIVTMIDSGADDMGALAGVFSQNRYKGEETYKFLLPGSLGYDFIRGDFEPGDEIGHGSATAATVVGGYNGQSPLTVVHYKIFGDQGLASYFGAIVAANSAIEINSTIINMSWGIPQERIPLALQCAVTRANQAGIAIVTTAGNEGVSIDDPTVIIGAQPQWPGAFSDPAFRFANLLTVGSMAYPDFDLNQEPVKVDYSNFSATRVDVAAYLTSATPRWRATDIGDIEYLAGTSISAPIVTRSLAAYLGPNGSDLPTWISDRLQQSTPLEVQGHVQNGLFLPLCADL